MKQIVMVVLVSFVASVSFGEMTVAKMEKLGKRIAAGDPKAFSDLEKVQEDLYKNIDYGTEEKRVRSNLVLMRAAFNVLGEEAGKGNERALKALMLATGKSGLRSFTSDA